MDGRIFGINFKIYVPHSLYSITCDAPLLDAGKIS